MPPSASPSEGFDARLNQNRLVPIPISDEERRTGTTSYSTIQSAVEAYHRDGFVCLSNAVSHESLDKMSVQMLKDTDTILQRPGTHFNQGKATRNISQPPPLSQEFLIREIWANPHAIAVLENILGPKPQLSFVNSNTALPGGSARQAVHSDAYSEHLDFAHGVVVNIYLSDVSAENGSTEVWLGSHNGTNKKDHISDVSGWIRQDVFTERAKISPPFQPTIPKGSVCLRDLRLWHAGMPNRTDTPRIMLAFVWFPRWYRSLMRLVLPEDTREIVEAWTDVEIAPVTKFVPGPVDHLGIEFLVNFTQTENGVVQGSEKGIVRGGKLMEPMQPNETNWLPGTVPEAFVAA
jgi:ectoine hydroxylase-related dioxygenase (phytanoyl-CoA dioxygenase family)